MSTSFAGTNTGRVPGYKQATLQAFTPEQMNLFHSLFSQVGPDSQLGQLAAGSPQAFEQLEKPALKQFAGLQGNLASRFSGAGTGTRKSSGFGIAAGQQAQDFASLLQSQRVGLQQQALRDLFNMSNILFNQKPYENFYTREHSFGNAILQGLPTLAGAGIGALAGGPAGALAGAKIGGSFGSHFGPQQPLAYSQLG